MKSDGIERLKCDADGPMSQMIASHAAATAAIREMSEALPTLMEIAGSLIETLQRGGVVYLCGNGGSAADADHVAAEFVGRFRRARGGLPAVSLSSSGPLLTALGNDFGFDEVFARQIESYVKNSDSVVGITTSGQSNNVLKAIQSGQRRGATTIGFTGLAGNNLTHQVDHCFVANSDNTARIQEAHIVAWHLICDVVDAWFSEDRQ